MPSEFLYPGLVDFIVMLICIAGSLALNVVCIYGDIEFCFTQDIYQASACILSFLYYELWFLVKVGRMTYLGQNPDTMTTTSTKIRTHQVKVEVFQLSLLTGSMALIYLAGSLSYKTWGGNFYTNAMWNLGWCMLPLLSVQSVMSKRFMSLFKAEQTGLVEADQENGRIDNSARRGSTIAGEILELPINIRQSTIRTQSINKHENLNRRRSNPVPVSQQSQQQLQIQVSKISSQHGETFTELKEESNFE
ncbi:hypothetical protein HK100_009748 [Physocladia obscura]|uniref:Transmembrane protein n=1 Tax=Physocladia obscura TaxID=109957 RepID=A0AAD5XHH3_9FUNG|nr:hypothetical protein HK100_009748 [Physocladia obscura]